MILSIYCLSPHAHPAHSHILTAWCLNAHCSLGSGSIYSALMSTSSRLYFITTLFRDSYWDSKHRSSFRYLPCRSKVGKQAADIFFCYFLNGKDLQEGLQHRIYMWLTFSPAPLSSLYFTNLIFYQAGNKRVSSIKRLGTVVLPRTLFLLVAREDPKILYWEIKMLFCTAEIIITDCMESSIGDDISPGKDFIIGSIT